MVLGRDLVVVPKLIHPLPPAISSPETSPERAEDTWMQVVHLSPTVQLVLCNAILSWAQTGNGHFFFFFFSHSSIFGFIPGAQC